MSRTVYAANPSPLIFPLGRSAESAQPILIIIVKRALTRCLSHQRFLMARNTALETHVFHHASLCRGASDLLSLFRIQMCVLISVLHRPSIFKNRTHKVQGWGWRRRWVTTPLIVFLRPNGLASLPLCQHCVLLHIGASGEIRTHNLLITNQLRYHCATLAYE